MYLKICKEKILFYNPEVKIALGDNNVIKKKFTVHSLPSNFSQFPQRTQKMDKTS